MSLDRAPRTAAEVTEPQLIGVTVAEGRVEMYLVIPSDLIYFRGHFPDFAVLPGVVQIDWAMIYSQRYFNLIDISAGSLQIKFHQVIRPGDHVLLTLVHRPMHAQIQFTYTAKEATLSSGRIGLEPL